MVRVYLAFSKFSIILLLRTQLVDGDSRPESEYFDSLASVGYSSIIKIQ